MLHKLIVLSSIVVIVIVASLLPTGHLHRGGGCSVTIFHQELSPTTVVAGPGGPQLSASPGRIEVAGNGTNEDRICLMAPPEFSGFQYIPDVDVAQAINLYRSRFTDLLSSD